MINNICGSNEWTDHSPLWGAFQLRYWSGNPVARKITLNNIKNGDGLQVIYDQHRQARDAGAFTIHRTMHNHHGENHADDLGLTFDHVEQWDGSAGSVVDYDRPENILILRGVEESVRDKAGHLMDAVQIGWGLLGENNFGRTLRPSHTIEGQMAFFNMMREVWGKKLQVCIGGSYGNYTDNNGHFVPKQWLYLLLEAIASTGWRWYGEFQDSYGKENWDTLYKVPYGIWDQAGVGDPIIKHREVTGGCNQLNTHPRSIMTSQQAYDEFISREYTFFHNMGCWPSYSGTEDFIVKSLGYVPQQVASYRAEVGNTTPLPGRPVSVRVKNGVITLLQTVPTEDDQWENAKGSSEYTFSSTHPAKVSVTTLPEDRVFQSWFYPDPQQPNDGPLDEVESWFRTNERGDLIEVEAVYEDDDPEDCCDRVDLIEKSVIELADEVEDLGNAVVTAMKKIDERLLKVEAYLQTTPIPKVEGESTYNPNA